MDGYAGYNVLPDVKLVGCWAHARRKFTEALQVLPESVSTSTVKAKEGLAYCNKLFEIERKLKRCKSRGALSSTAEALQTRA
ncbi:hypothetical protein APP_01960 [Aeribacillus pallidus]|nr:hypothetical protein APP_01960 [Aeribacillus pallidus]